MLIVFLAALHSIIFYRLEFFHIDLNEFGLKLENLSFHELANY